jgi:2-polyprenyl-3-methyl-5-hydroxy-6-metoxy-1,4-benzoquinol methylase
VRCVSFRFGSKSYFTRKRVVDVGCGTGLVGICTALLGAHAILTDLCAPPQPHLRHHGPCGVPT